MVSKTKSCIVALLCRKNKNTAMQQLFYVEKANNIHSCFVDNGLREPSELITVQGVDYVSGLLIEDQFMWVVHLRIEEWLPININGWKDLYHPISSQTHLHPK